MSNPLKLAALRWAYPSVHGVRIQIPWDTNEPQYGRLHYAFSKGSRQQIIAYTESNCPYNTRWQIEGWMKGDNPQEIRVGIDCSGFVYRILDEAAELSGARSLRETLGRTCEYTPLDLLTPRDRIIRRAVDVRPGDSMRFNRGKHSGVIVERVTDTAGTLREIWYAHSSFTRGPHIGWIEVGDPAQPIDAASQNWHDDMWDRLTNNSLRDLYFTSVHESPFYEGFRPSVVKQTGITIEVDGRLIESAVPPFVLAGRTLCQLRPLAEAMGAKVTWTQASQMVTMTRESRVATCQVGSEVGIVDSRGYLLDEPPIYVGQDVVVPVRFLAEAMGYTVTWDQEHQRVSLRSDRQIIHPT